MEALKGRNTRLVDCSALSGLQNPLFHKAPERCPGLSSCAASRLGCQRCEARNFRTRASRWYARTEHVTSRSAGEAAWFDRVPSGPLFCDIGRDTK